MSTSRVVSITAELLGALATPSIDEIFMDSGDFVLPAEGIRIDRPLKLHGAPGTILWTNGPVDALTIASDYVALDTIQIKPGGGGAPNVGVVRILGPAVGVRLRRVRLGFAGPSGIGFLIEGLDIGSGAVQHVLLEDCEAVGLGGHGLLVRNATAMRIVGGSYGGNGFCGIHAEVAIGLRVWGPSLERNQVAGTDPTYGAQLRLKLCHGFNVQGLHVENFAAKPTVQNGLVIEACRAGLVGTSLFGNPNAAGTGIRVLGSEAIRIDPQHVGGLAAYVNVDAASKNVEIGPPASTTGALSAVIGANATRNVRKTY